MVPFFKNFFLLGDLNAHSPLCGYPLGIPSEQFNPTFYYIKISKDTLHPSLALQSIISEGDFSGHQRIFTDGSKMDSGVGSAFCVFNQNDLIFAWKATLCKKNSVYQAELTAIYETLKWISDSPQPLATQILIDSLSSLLALQNMETTDGLVARIKQLLQEIFTKVQIHFSWVRGHTGIQGNELADQLARVAAQDSSQLPIFVLFPTSFLKYKLPQKQQQDWQHHWDVINKGRYTHKFFHKVKNRLPNFT